MVKWRRLDNALRRVHFTSDSTGRRIFFPRALWPGLESRGYIVEDHAAEERIMVIVRRSNVFQILAFAAAILLALSLRELGPTIVRGANMKEVVVRVVLLYMAGAVAGLTMFAGVQAWYVNRVRPLVKGLARADNVAVPSWQVFADPDAQPVSGHLQRVIAWGVIAASLLAVAFWQASAPSGDRVIAGMTVFIALFAAIASGSHVVAVRTRRLKARNEQLERQVAERTLQLEAASRHKSEFLANMSHELRTPLNAIIGFSEALSERMFGDLNEKQAEYVNDIHTSGKHLLALINDILDLSKVEAGRMELDLAEFDPHATLENALTLVRERAQRHGIRLKLEAQPGVGPIVADERKLKQILLNLLSNAVKFTPEGGTVTLAAASRDGGLQIAVSDTGVGIAPEDQQAIFEEFRQVGRDYTRKAEGTGLGLALTRRFVELHGGTIRVESIPGAGSTFTFTLPVRHG